MATARNVIDYALTQVGIMEVPANSNNVIYNTHYYGGAVSGSDYPWCCAFVWDIFRLCGCSELFYGGMKTAYCPTYESWAKAQGLSVGVDNGRIGDVVTFDFGKGRAQHIGFILGKNSDGTYQTLEGNTSVSSDDNGGAVMIRTRAKSQMRYIFRPRYDEVKNVVINQWDLRKEVNRFGNVAKNEGWAYGDKHAINERVTSCDRSVFESLYNLGFKDQQMSPSCFETVVSCEDWFLRHGFSKILNKTQLKPADIVLMKYNGETKPTWRWHMFLIDRFNNVNDIDKYDFGSQSRIRSGGWSRTKLNEWSDKSWYAAFRLPTKDANIQEGDYKIVSAMQDDRVMDVADGSTDRRANIQLYKDNGTEAQVFHIRKGSDGLYVISSKKSGLVFDIANGSLAKGGNLWQYKVNNTPAQKWFIQEAERKGYVTIINRQSGLCLEAADGSTAKRTNIRQWSKKDTPEQQWKLVRV